MKQHLKAAVVVCILAVLTLIAYNVYLQPKFTAAPRDFQSLHLMETQGVDNFSYKNLEGQSAAFGDLKDKVVILNFWASWCTPCIEEVPSLIKLVQEFKGDVQLIAVSGDSSREDIDVFLKSFPELRTANIHLVWDEDRSLMKKFEVNKLPESLVLGKDQKLVKKIIGTIDWHTPDSVEYIKSLLAK